MSGTGTGERHIDAYVALPYQVQRRMDGYSIGDCVRCGNRGVRCPGGVDEFTLLGVCWLCATGADL